jgi:ribosomal protein S4
MMWPPNIPSLKSFRIRFKIFLGGKMARYLGSKCKKCRQLNFSVCGSERCVLLERAIPPGMPPHLRRKVSDYKKRLIEKQRLRFSYWIAEKQFRNYVKKAFKKERSPERPLSAFLNGGWTTSFFVLDLLRPF